MKETRHFLTLGIASVIAIATAAFFFGWLRGALTKYTTVNVEFRDAQGMKDGSEVRMAGVRIGSVQNVALTPQNTALLQLRIGDKFKVPEGSRFVVTTSLLGGTPSLTVVPGAGASPIADNNSPAIAGEGGGGLEMTLNDGRDLVASLRKTTDKLAEFSNDPRTSSDLRATLTNLRESTAALPKLQQALVRQITTLSNQTNVLLVETQVSQRRLAGKTERLLTTFDKSASKLGGTLDRNANALAGDLRGTINENRATLKSLLKSTDDSLANLNGLLEGSKGLIADPKIKQNLLAVTDNLNTITAKLAKTTENLQALSGDEEITANLKATTLNVREATANVRDLTARFGGIRLPGEKRKPNTSGESIPPAPSSSLQNFASLTESGLAADAVLDTDADRFRLNANYTLLRPGKSFYRVGLFDITEDNRLSLQVGQGFGDSIAFRYGILQGKLGIGADVRAGHLFDLRLDLFDPNRATLNGRIKKRLTSGLSITGGMDSIGKENRATIGVQILR